VPNAVGTLTKWFWVKYIISIVEHCRSSGRCVWKARRHSLRPSEYRTVEFSIYLQKPTDWTLWRSRPPSKRKYGLLATCVAALWEHGPLSDILSTLTPIGRSGRAAVMREERGVCAYGQSWSKQGQPLLGNRCVVRVMG
jgi:hypothetical protein